MREQFHILNKDIRHVPEAPPPTRSRKSSSLGTGASSPLRSTQSGKSPSQDTPPTTLSAADPATFERRVRSKLRQAKRHQQQKTIPEEPASGYWNEYDDPDSEFGGDSGGYVIYIDPNAPIFPGQRTLEKWYGSIKGMFGGKKQRDLERQNSTDTLGSTESSDDDDEEIEGALAASSRLLRRSMPGYGATPSVTADSARRSSVLVSKEEQDRMRSRHAWSSTICFAAAVIILSILTLLSNTGRRKAKQRVEVGTLLGVAAALAFAGIGMGNLLTLSLRRNAAGARERRRLMWMNAFKWLVAVAVCVWAGWLGAGVVL